MMDWEAVAGITLWLVVSLCLVIIGVGAAIIWWWFELPFLPVAAAGGACLAVAGLVSLARPTV